MFEKLLIKLQLHVIGKLSNYKLHPITLKIVINYINYKLQLLHPWSVDSVRRHRTDGGPLLYYIYAHILAQMRQREWRTLENCPRVTTNQMKFQK